MNLRRSKFFIFLSLILFLSISFNVSNAYGQSYLGDEDDVNVSEEADSEEADSKPDKSHLREQVACGNINQLCCLPYSKCNNTSLVCRSGWCRACGNTGQPCCNARGILYCSSRDARCPSNGTCR